MSKNKNDIPEVLDEEDEYQAKLMQLKQNKIALAIGLIVIALLIFFICKWLFSGKKPDEKSIVADLDIVPQTVQTQAPLPIIPSLPDIPKPDNIAKNDDKSTIPIPPPINNVNTPTQDSKGIEQSIPTIMDNNIVSSIVPPSNNKQNAQAKNERIKSQMIVGGGGERQTDTSQVITSYYTPSRTRAAQVQAGYVGVMASTITQGKVIDAVLETAINSDFPGVIRALVSRDIYAEMGKAVLIPKGSRLVGEYASGVARGQTRIAVIWHRIIRPDGIDIMVESVGTDKIGRTGVKGDVDSKYFEMVANAVLASTFTIAWAKASDKITGSTASTTTTVSSANGGGTTSTSTSNNTDDAIKSSTANINEAIKNATSNSLVTSPTISIDQGTKLKVMVQQDLVFPANMVSNIGSR